VGWLDDGRRQVGRIARAAEARAAPGVVFAAAVIVWWLQAIVMPLTGGRDFGTYLGAYAELFQSDPIDLGYVLGRTPIAPLVTGALLDPLDGVLAEPGMSLLYGASVTAWFLAARAFGGGAALVATAVVFLYPSYGILFHELSSDSVLAAAFAGWSLLVVRVLLKPSVPGFALVGIGIAMLVLVRPGHQALLALAVLPLLLAFPWRLRLAGSAAIFLSAASVLALWTVHNGVRFGDYTVARGGNSRLPFERIFLTERIVRPENGPSSRRLADAVDRKLLPEEPYRSYGIGLDDFFSDPSPRMKDDLGALAIELDGWKSDERLLRDVAIEAIRAHPGPYARGVAKTIFDLLRQPVYRPLAVAGAEGETGGKTQSSDAGDTIVVNGRVLPRPSEGERIPGPHEGGPTTPDHSIYTVWTSPTERHLVFVHPGDEQRYDDLHRRIDELAANLPDREGEPSLARRINQLSRVFPPPLLWIAVALVALAIRRPANVVALGAPAIAAFVVIVMSALAITAVSHYAVPGAPAFALLMAGALLGPSKRLPHASSPAAPLASTR
jgi:hypothetical protein